jgi:hypothetical protein
VRRSTHRPSCRWAVYRVEIEGNEIVLYLLAGPIPVNE